MTHTQNKKQALNKMIISDYEMNQIVANNIINIIESGNVQEWKKGWNLKKKDASNHSKLGLYQDVVNGEIAINVYNLTIFDFTNTTQAMPAGFYVTFNDIKKHNLRLNKGAKGFATYKLCFFYKNLTVAQKIALDALRTMDAELDAKLNDLFAGKIHAYRLKFDYVADGEDRFFDEEVKVEHGELVYSRVQYVLEYQFNIDQLASKLDVKAIWGIKGMTFEPKQINTNSRIDEAEAIRIDYCERANLKYQELYQDRAFYTPSTHSVTLPTFNQFDSSEEFYSTMFHELAHSTGAESLLNRKGICSFHKWGDTTYAKEELVAELSSIFTMKALGLATDLTFKNSIAYLASWGASLKEGIKHNILNTILHSQKATELILNINQKDTGAKNPVSEVKDAKEENSSLNTNIATNVESKTSINRKEINKEKKASKKSSTKTIKIVCRKNGEMVADDVAANKFDQLDVDGKVINLFIHRDYENKNKWAITEEATGLLVGSQFKTKNDAIKAYKETLKDRVVYLLKYNYSNYLKMVDRFKGLLEKVGA